jgi:DNA invertase Pin-like site-specific DNA recombinase
MSDHDKITAMHLRRAAFVYIRQSPATQVEHNRESTARQYALADARWNWVGGGFAQLTTEVALGHVGIVLGLEVSRLARNNADWYRLLDLCGMTDTLIGDADGVYHPGLFNDRLVLGLKGTL